MASHNHIINLQFTVASGKLVPVKYLPSLPGFPSPLELLEKSPKILPYNSFLIPKNNRLVPLPVSKPLSRWGRFQLWFNAYR